MPTLKNLVGPLAVALVAAALASAAQAQNPRPLSETDLVRLIELQLDDRAILSRLDKAGVSFAVTDAVRQRLKTAGASDAVLAALDRTAGKKTAAARAITFDNVLELLKLGVEEPEVLKRLEKSPTVFTLDGTQIEALKKAGASARLVEAMQGKRSAASTADVTDFVIILDCSGSMIDKTPEGTTKMAAARRVVSDLIGRIPNGRNVAFIIYGHDVELKCKAVKVVRPLSELTDDAKRELRAAISRLQPVGHTPIALALRVAGQELAKHDGLSGLILITDGMETCHGNPSEEAARLAANPKLTFGLHVIGFGVDAQEKEAVREIARAGKGKFYDARTAADLGKTVGALAEKIPDVPRETPAIARARSAVSVVKVNPLTLEGLPALKQAYVVKPGTDPRAPFFKDKVVGSTKQFGAAIPVAPGTYDVVVQPASGSGVTLVKGLRIQEHEAITINPNRLIAAVLVKDPQVEGLRSPARVCLVTAGRDPNAVFFNDSVHQDATGYGRPMLVAPGTAYDVVVVPARGQRVTIAHKITPQPGQLTVVGGAE